MPHRILSLYIVAAWMLQPLLAPLVRAADDSGNTPPGAAPVYRFSSRTDNRHFYTIEEAEKAKLLAEHSRIWIYDGVAFLAFASGSDEHLAPVHRFWSERLNTHFYTIDEQEADSLIIDQSDVWTYEGIGFYAYPSGREPAGTAPVHRFWSDSAGAHFYTISDRERFEASDGSAGPWQYEGVAYHVYPPPNADGVRIVNGPALQWVTPGSATMQWETNAPAATEIHYGRGAVEENTASDPACVTLHKVVLSELVPGALYTYTVTSGPASRTGTFSSAPLPEQPFRFAVYGDSRTYPEVHARIARNLLDSRPQLVLHTGDLVGIGRNLDVWETEFFKPAAELMAHAPIVPVLGNHELYGTGPLWFHYFFDYPNRESWFAFTYGNTRFIGLDTNTAFPPGSPQHDWLLQELASPACQAATWRVVFLHEPPFTSTAAYGDNETIKGHLVPLFELHDVDVVFAGHSHTYERYWHNDVSYIVTGGGGGPLYSLRPDLSPPIRQFGFTTYHHCVVDVDPAAGTLALSTIDIDGKIFDAVTLSK